MNEEKKEPAEEKVSEEKKPENAAPNEDARIQSETASDLDRAEKVVAEQKVQNDRKEDLVKREESLHAKKMVGGKAEAGQPDATPTFSDDEIASRKRIAAVAAASGSSWGKKYE